jgi:hypothetical protein
MEPTPTPTIFPGDTATKKKRASKELPDDLSELNERNFRRSMDFRLETDFYEQSEVMVAYRARKPDSPSASFYELDKLTLDNLRRICRNVGVLYVNKCVKFQCRKALWIIAASQEKKEKEGAIVSTATERASCNIIRLCNVLFSHHFFDSLLSRNDIKTRADHEYGKMPSDFWFYVADTLNGAEEDDDTAFTVVLN